MDRNSVIGFILIALILFGFTFVQSRQARRRAAEAVAIPGAVAADRPAEMPDTVGALEIQPTDSRPVYKDAALERARNAGETIFTLENDKFAVAFTSRGARPYSATVKGHKTYAGGPLQIFVPGSADYNVSVYAGEYVSTRDFVFDVHSRTDSSVVFRLALDAGGYIEQKYTIRPGEYMVYNSLSFVGMEKAIPRNVSGVDVDFSLTVPRSEKGFKNESQYSKMDWYFSGDKKPSEMGRGRSGSKRIDSRLSWFAFQQQFFSAIMRAPEEFANAELAITFADASEQQEKLMDCSARTRVDITPGTATTIPFEFYFGPNHLPTLKEYGAKFDKIIPLGGWLVGWFTRYFIIPMFNFLNRYIMNFGLIILIMTLVIKIIVLPFTYKSFASSAKMQALRPLMEKINEKYPKQEDAMKKQQATMELYKRAGVSPLGGCLPTLLTFPILWAMFRFFPASIELRQQGFLWAEDLSAYDSIVDFGGRIPLVGDHLSLFALLMAVVMWFYSKMTTANQTASNDPTASSMKFMTVWMMPIMMFFICNNLSSGLSYYYLLSQLISMVEVWVIKKTVNQQEILDRVAASQGKPLPKSKWQQRLEEAQRLQEQQMRQQRRR